MKLEHLENLKIDLYLNGNLPQTINSTFTISKRPIRKFANRNHCVFE